MTHDIKPGDRFRATAPNGDVFEGTAVKVEGCDVITEFNYLSFSCYDFERLSTSLATEVGALYGLDETPLVDFIVRVEEPDSGNRHPWYANVYPFGWHSDAKAEELIQERGWVRLDDRNDLA